MNFDVIIRNAVVVDGTNSPWFKADVGILNGRIDFVGKIPLEATGKEEVDAKGKVLCPGFIDGHTHADFVLLQDPLMLSKLKQGVTTQIIGQCGISPAPVTDDKVEMLDQYVGFFKGGTTLDWTWRSFGGWLDKLETLSLGTNIGACVGQGTVRLAVMGFENRQPTQDEMEKMRAYVEEAIDSGAFGLTSGLIYPPGVYSSHEELCALTTALKKKNALYLSHMRSESGAVVESVMETIDIGHKNDIPVQISHHKAAGKMYWGLVQTTLQKVDEARANGVDVTLDLYPYDYSSTTLRAILPAWIQEGGLQKLNERLADPSVRKQVMGEIKTDVSWDNYYLLGGCSEGITLLYTPKTPECEGKTLSEVGKLMGKSPIEAAFDIIVANGGSDTVCYNAMSEDDVQYVMKHPAAMFVSDSIFGASGGKSHPRTFGTNPRVLCKYVREEKVLTIEQAVWKMTGFPAARYGLQTKGIIREGMDADIVIFDPETVRDKATIENPQQDPEGIEYVFVNGVKTVEKGVCTGKTAGRVLRKK